MTSPRSSDAVAGTTTPTGLGTSTLTAVRETQARRNVQFLSPAAPLYQERSVLLSCTSYVSQQLWKCRKDLLSTTNYYLQCRQLSLGTLLYEECVITYNVAQYYLDNDKSNQ